MGWHGKNLGLGSEKSTTNCLSHGKAKRSNKKVGSRGILNFQNMEYKGTTVLAGNSDSFQTLGSTVLW